ncbi:sugar phosphate isomerase/epimerase family protein [Metabacillus herbersteinensis]|uniref:Sugar phosphate isomerase/epimerase family protein n=1 Tax=Metabacillus herbersteinensis TaxID=283816 RepID=A0ABV6GBQ0_9BACI
MTIGLQMYSVREKTEKDFLGTIERVAEMGYDSVQFAGYFDTPSEQLKELLDRTNMKVAGSHLSIDVLQGDRLDETLQYNREIDNDLIILPYLTEDMRKSAEDYRAIAVMLNEIGAECKRQGFTFAYHNHDFEFQQFDGQTGFEILFSNTDPELVKIELDCYWATYAGLEPTSIIEQYGDRIVSLHLKDMKEVDGTKRSIEIGSGVLDIGGLIKVGKEAGVKWFVVEQEQFDSDPMESSKVNYTNLSSILEKNQG